MRYVGQLEDGSIAFYDDRVNVITDNMYPISDEVYFHFFDMQSSGKCYKLKDPKGKTFDEIFEEYTPVPPPYIPTDMDRINWALNYLILGIGDHLSDYLGQRIIDNALDYSTVAKNKPDFKGNIDKYLKDNGHGDLIKE